MFSNSQNITTDIGSLPQNWEIKSLPEVLSFIVDNRGRTAPTSEKGIALIATNCIKEDALYPVKDKIRFVDQNTFNTWFRAHPQPHDIIFVNKGTPGLVCLVPDPVDFCIAQDMVALRPDETKIYGKYLFAYLRSPQFKNQVQGLNVGTTIPHLKKTLFDRLLIPIPSRLEQEAIGNIYFYLSKQIEVNLQLNQTLESIAQAIFKQWFIDFQFPGATAEMENEIPKGWKIQQLNEVITKIQYGLTQSAVKEEVGPKFLRITDIQGGKVNWDQVPYCEVSDNDYTKYKIDDGDIFIARTGASTGENAFILNPPKSVFASYLIRLQISNTSMRYYIAKFLRTTIYKNFIQSLLGGSAQPNANAQVLTSVMVTVPDDNTLKQFAEIIEPLERKKFENESENSLLTNIRNSLLPKLVTGKIPVNQ